MCETGEESYPDTIRINLINTERLVKISNIVSHYSVTTIFCILIYSL